MSPFLKALFFVLLFSLTGCTTQGTPDSLVVLGEAEHVLLEPEHVLLAARIDTGADTSAISATNIEPFKKDGRQWVRFTIDDMSTQKPVVLERIVLKRIRIRRTQGEDEIRMVVGLTMQIGKLKLTREFGLTDRSRFTHEVLIGRNFLDGQALVDVSKRYTVGVPRQ